MEFWIRYSSFVLTLIAVLDPFFAIPFFLSQCAGRSDADRRRIARAASLTVLAVLEGAALSGEALLHVVGTSLASFRIAGGVVLLLMALAMLLTNHGDDTSTGRAASMAGPNQEVGVVPLAIPLLAGPGAISTVMIAAQQGGWQNRLAIAIGIAIVCLVLWLMLRLAAPIGRLFGPVGLSIATRLLGLLLAAIAVEFMAIGLKELFPSLAG